MKRQTRSEQIQNAIDTTLSGLKDDPRLAQRIITEAKGEIKAKKKISVGFVFIFVLMMIAATALAVTTIREIAQMMAKTEQEVGWFVDWPVEKKTAVIATLTEQDCIQESDDVRQLIEGNLNPDDANRIADELISSFTGQNIEDVSFLVIMQAAWGPFDSWSDENRAWYSALMEDVGVEPNGKTVYVLPEGEITKEQAVEIAKNAILTEMGIEENVLDNYNLTVNFQVPEFAEEDDQQPYWYVMYEAKENSPDNPFSAIELFVHPQTGELLESVDQILEGWADLPRRPDNALYQAIDTYFDRAKTMGAYSFYEWPLELRAEYSQDITPRVQAILVSGDLSDLINCGNPDLSVIAQSTYIYGLPDENALTQEDAYALARTALMDVYGLPFELFEKYRMVYVYYDITSTPMWKFFFNPNTLDAQQIENGYDNPVFNTCYKAGIDAQTGEVMFVEQFDFQLGSSDLEYKLKWY